MAMTVSIDPRPTVIGNLLLVTGTFQDDGTRSGAIELASFFSSLIHVDANGLNDQSTVGFQPAAGSVGINIACAGGNIGGTWIALGIRG